jgi:hypothetical protein
LSITGASNITVEGGTYSDSGGDGVMVAGGGRWVKNGTVYDRTNFSTGVTLRAMTVSRAWRNGLSVISAKDLLVEDCTFQDTAGTNPQFGIDLEPDVLPYVMLSASTLPPSDKAVAGCASLCPPLDVLPYVAWSLSFLVGLQCIVTWSLRSLVGLQCIVTWSLRSLVGR